MCVWCWGPTYFSAFFVFCLTAAAAAAAVSCLYHTVPEALKLYYVASHGTTTVAQQVCLDHLHACVGIAYTCVCDGCVCCDAMIRQSCGMCNYCCFNVECK